MARVVAALALGAAGAAAQVNVTGSVYLKGDTWSFTPGVLDPKSVAWATYTDWTARPSGFGQISVVTNKAGTFNDSVLWFGAGYVEGALTWQRIVQHRSQIHGWILSQFGGGPIPQKYLDFFATQDAWARAQAATNTSGSWRGISLIFSQFDGLVAGYNAFATTPLTSYDIAEINAVGDWLDLIPALGDMEQDAYMKPFDWYSMTAEQIIRRVHETTHCSALVKVTGDLSEMFFAHSAWFTYLGTNRLWKDYDFSFSAAGFGHGQIMSFASYPGMLSSLDDYYSMWSSGLVMLETTNSIMNMSLYKLVVPQSLWAWQRVRTANLVANTGREWYEAFATANSGTYNNQYMIINVKAFTPQKALPADLLWVIEQIPGLVVGGDTTQQLERGYWPSYNVAYWPEIYQRSGYRALIDHVTKGQGYTGADPISGIDYQLAPRAKIFRRDANAVNDTQSFLNIMRYNDYLHDPYAGGSPWGAICSRGDLASGGGPDGCYDTKAGQASLFATRQTYVVNGPTRGGNSNLPPFAWTQFPSDPHVGLPDVYNFDFELVAPM